MKEFGQFVAQFECGLNNIRAIEAITGLPQQLGNSFSIVCNYEAGWQRIDYFLKAMIFGKQLA
ncbi:hypothetical protein QTO30_20035 [Yoonia sp. GPGPB17]|uniref:hypothetical protein n=1 Tax=Yoonia sp. GPGPB17 TaxID=3026147 RepID=UPI0030BA7566